jgi:hypothetical protein
VGFSLLVVGQCNFTVDGIFQGYKTVQFGR